MFITVLDKAEPHSFMDVSNQISGFILGFILGSFLGYAFTHFMQSGKAPKTKYDECN